MHKWNEKCQFHCMKLLLNGVDVESWSFGCRLLKKCQKVIIYLYTFLILNSIWDVCQFWQYEDKCSGLWVSINSIKLGIILLGIFYWIQLLLLKNKNLHTQYSLDCWADIPSNILTIMQLDSHILFCKGKKRPWDIQF